jgi:phosphosulfolactate synthase
MVISPSSLSALKAREQGLYHDDGQRHEPREVEETFLEVASPYTDIVSWAYLCGTNLKRKLEIYREDNIRCISVARCSRSLHHQQPVRHYRRLYVPWHGYAKVSDSIDLDHDRKCEYIRELSKERCACSAVGSGCQKNHPLLSGLPR